MTYMDQQHAHSSLQPLHPCCRHAEAKRLWNLLEPWFKRGLVSLQCHYLDILRDGLLLKKRLRQTEVFWELAAPLPYQCFRFLVLHVGNALPVFGSILGSAHECCSEGSPFLAFDIWVKELSAPNLDNTLIQGMQDYFTILVCNPPALASLSDELWVEFGHWSEFKGKRCHIVLLPKEPA